MTMSLFNPAFLVLLDLASHAASDCTTWQTGVCASQEHAGHSMLQVQDMKHPKAATTVVEEHSSAITEQRVVERPKSKDHTCGACLYAMDCLPDKDKCDIALLKEKDMHFCNAFEKCKADAKKKCTQNGSCRESQAEDEAHDVYPASATMIQKRYTPKGPLTSLCGVCLSKVMNCLSDKEACDTALQNEEDVNLCKPFEKCKSDAMSRCTQDGSCSESEAEAEANSVYPVTMVQKGDESDSHPC